MDMTPRQLRERYQAEFDKWLTLYIQKKIDKKLLRKKSRQYFPLIEMYHRLEVRGCNTLQMKT